MFKRQFKPLLAIAGAYVIVAAFQNCAEPNKISPSDLQAELPSQSSKICVIFLTTSSAPWLVPSDWNSAQNSVEVVGGGGGGGITTPGVGWGGGGGGGAYAAINNLNLLAGNLVNYAVGAGGASASDGGDTWFNGADVGTASVLAKGGAGSASYGQGAPGGSATDSVGSILFSGGSGNGDAGAAVGGGGGGAGPNGAGLDGDSSGNGGAADQSIGGAGGSNTDGMTGREWDIDHGAGGGGGGQDGYNGGAYGGGGGAGLDNGSGTLPGGSGGPGLIVIRYLGSVCK